MIFTLLSFRSLLKFSLFRDALAAWLLYLKQNPSIVLNPLSAQPSLSVMSNSL